MKGYTDEDFWKVILFFSYNMKKMFPMFPP